MWFRNLHSTIASLLKCTAQIFYKLKRFILKKNFFKSSIYSFHSTARRSRMKSFNYHIKNKTIEDITQKCLFHSSNNSQYPSPVSDSNYWRNSLPLTRISIILRPQINPFISYSLFTSSQHDFKICWNHHKNGYITIIQPSIFWLIQYHFLWPNITQSHLQNEILHLFTSSSASYGPWNTSIISIYEVIKYICCRKNHQRLLQTVSNSQDRILRVDTSCLVNQACISHHSNYWNCIPVQDDKVRKFWYQF